MTREEAITLIKSAQLMLINPTTNEPVSDLYAALDIAIKALEQEPMLDKIRAEIIEKYWGCDICNYNGHFNIRGDINDILQIIDKYKAESEDNKCR